MDWTLKNYDRATTKAPDIDTELGRLKALKTFQLLDRERDPSFDRLAQVTARTLSAPFAFINLVDLGRVWQVASFGLPEAPPAMDNIQSSSDELPRDMPRATSLCAHTILQKEFLLVIPDLLQDSRFQDCPWAQAGIRFYAGTPLVSPEGAHVGTLCVMDSKSRMGALREEDQEQLLDMATAVMDLMLEKRHTLQAVEASEIVGYPIQVKRSATFLRRKLWSLKEDSDFQTVASDTHRSLLHSAYEGSDFLYESLGCKNDDAKDKAANQKVESIHPESSRDSSTSTENVGEEGEMDMDMFVRSLQTAMESFPRKVHLSISIHGGLPPQLRLNDLKVFRASIALLTSACERTQEGFVRFKIYPQCEGDKVVVFECEDTGQDVDLEHFEGLFRAPAGGIDSSERKRIPVDGETGQVQPPSGICGPQVDDPVAGGFAVHPVARLVDSMGGRYGFRPRFVPGLGAMDDGSGSVFWFSIPWRLSKAGTPAALSTSSLDSAIDSALGGIEHTALADSSSLSIHRVDPSVAMNTRH